MVNISSIENSLNALSAIKREAAIFELPTEVLTLILNYIAAIEERAPDEIKNYDTHEIRYTQGVLQKLYDAASVCSLFSEIVKREKPRLINKDHLSLKSLGFNTAEEAVAFAIEKKLTSVNLTGYGQEINDALIEKLEKNLPGLQHLFIPYSTITTKGLSHLSSLTRLLSLNLHDSYRINGASLLHLQNLRSLERLNLHHCFGIHKDAIARLKQSLPHLNVQGRTTWA